MDAAQKGQKFYTYEDYLTWNDGVRYELIEGVPYMMSSPSQEHQEILGELFGQLRDFLKGKPCKVFIAPFDVKLKINKRRDTVTQPDIMVVCDHSKLDGKAVNGAPDFIIEILSPSTSKMDTFIKLNKYREAGVREYWIVNPADKTIIPYILKDGVYSVNPCGEEPESISVHVLDGCVINLKSVFPK